QSVVQQFRRQVQMKLRRLRHRNIVLHNIAHQLEERVNLNHRDKSDHPQHEVEQKAGQDIAVHDQKQRDAKRVSLGSFSFFGQTAGKGRNPSPDSEAKTVEDVAIAGKFHAGDQDDSNETED